MSDNGLRDAIRKPLRLAGDKDEAAQDALVKAVRRDISDQPSDLPLMQVALRAAWREHRAAGIGLVEAYESVGGVLGALANEAEAVRNRLTPEDQARLESIFVRLVRLGDTGGATRRTAALDEFDEARRGLVQRLGKDEYGRLVVVGETSAEIAHEALITQWPWLQGRLKDDARDVRRLDRLMEKAQEWRDAPADKKASYLAAGAERELFDELAKQRGDWLSRLDRDFVEASNRAHETERERETRDVSGRASQRIRRPDRAREHRGGEASGQRGQARARRLAARQRRYGDAEACRDARRTGPDRASYRISFRTRDRDAQGAYRRCAFGRLQPGRVAHRHPV